MIEWALSLAAMAGAVLNAKRRRAGFLVWMVTNAGWCLVSIHRGQWAQVPMWGTYLLISAWAWREWGKK